MLTKLRDFWNISNQMHSVSTHVASGWLPAAAPPSSYLQLRSLLPYMCMHCNCQPSLSDLLCCHSSHVADCSSIESTSARRHPANLCPLDRVP